MEETKETEDSEPRLPKISARVANILISQARIAEMRKIARE
jgi:hypothetical protein